MGSPASRILRFARTRRCCTVGSLIRNARAISREESPPTVRSVSATRASIGRAGWQHVKISRSRSSGICCIVRSQHLKRPELFSLSLLDGSYALPS